MRTLYLRNVPDEVGERLQRLAAREGLSVSAFATRELAVIARRDDNPALLADLPDLGVEASAVVGAVEEGARPAVIVIDASAAVLGLLNDGDARATLRTASVACPHLADSEVAHALRLQVLRGEVVAEDASRALDAWGRLGVERVGVRGLLGRIWELRDNLSAYDATYVAVAEAFNAPLVTADARLARAPGPRCAVTVIRR